MDNKQEQQLQNEESWKDSDFLNFNDDENDNDEDDVDENNNSNNETGRGKDNNLSSRDYNQNVSRGSSSHTTGVVTSYINLLTSSPTSVFEIPPWMTLDPTTATRMNQYNNNRQFPNHNSREPPLVALHNEIVDFVALMEPQPDELQVREDILQTVISLIKETFPEKEITATGKKCKPCQIQVFGSQATGLLLPTSDIDLVVTLDESLFPHYNFDTSANSSNNSNNGNPNTNPTNPDNNNNNNNAPNKNDEKNNTIDPNTLTAKEQEHKEMNEFDINNLSSTTNTTSPLIKLGNTLKTKWGDELSYLEVIENTRIPIVKFTHKKSNISVDICFNQSLGPKAADLMKRFLDAMPPLKPLTYVLKYFMTARGLNEPYTGGIGSYMLQMMIVSFLQHRERESYNNGKHRLMNLGSLLIEFFELYGIDFNYMTTGISVRCDGSYFPKGSKDKKDFFWNPSRPFSLAVENPLEPESDIGKGSFRMQLIQRSFEVAFRTLMVHTSDPVVGTVSLLGTILPPTEEMHKRAAMVKVLRIEEQLNRNGFRTPNSRNNGNNTHTPNNNYHNNKRQRSHDSDMDTSSSSSGGLGGRFQRRRSNEEQNRNRSRYSSSR